MVMPNLYGTIVNNTCSGITGGLAMTPGFDIGENFQVKIFYKSVLDKEIDI
jgi:isocitrate/isopropylmalate dehydrogenase